jgi:PAS domain S-box-containing protein
MKVYYNQIKQIRKKQKLTISEFCKKAGIGRATLWTWETGKQFPSEKKVELIAETLCISVDEISDLPPKKEKSEVKLSETVNSWLLLNDSNTLRKIQEQEELITKIRIQQTESLQASVLIKAMMSTIQSYFYIKDSNLKYLIANEIFLKNSSLNKDFNVSGKDDHAFFPMTEAIANHEQDLEVFKSGKSIIKQECYIPGNRKKKWGLASKFPLYDSLGKIAGIIGTFIDLTEQKKLEEEKKRIRMHQMLESTFSTPFEILWLISYKPKREYLYISNSIEKMLGYPTEKFYNDKNFWLNNCVHPDYKEQQEKLVKTGTCPRKMEYKLINSIGKTVWVEEFTFKEKFNGKECIGFITRDISQRKKNEEELAEKIKNQIIEKLGKEEIDQKILDKISKISL